MEKKSPFPYQSSKTDQSKNLVTFDFIHIFKSVQAFGVWKFLGNCCFPWEIF